MIEPTARGAIRAAPPAGLMSIMRIGSKARFRAGDWVEIRSKEEILSTLDRRARLEELPFMPQMFEYCGKRFRVFKRAHKTCDTINNTGGRRMRNAVHLQGLRCDGAAYGGCQAGCLLFWKEEWLKRVEAGGNLPGCQETQRGAAVRTEGQAAGCREQDVSAGTRREGVREEAEPVYVCQATQLHAATSPLPWWDFRQYVEDYASGNTCLRTMVKGGFYAGYQNLIQAGIGLGEPLKWIYDRYRGVRGGVPYPRKRGLIPVGQPTPSVSLGLQPGEWVRVKSFDEILATLDRTNRNRGLFFDAEEVPYCGGIYRVRSRVTQLIDEKTGKMLNLKEPSVILEGVCCKGWYSDRRMFCPRSIYPLWKEVWLERTDSPPTECGGRQMAGGEKRADGKRLD